MAATPARRRSALQEIPNSPLSIVTDVDNSIIESPGSLSNSFLSSAPSPDELIIRQRGRRSISITSWSPPNCNNNNDGRLSNNNNCCIDGESPKSPLKTPTKNNPQLQMVLRSSPRKRVLLATSDARKSMFGETAIAPMAAVATPGKLLECTKRLRITEKSYAQQDNKVSLSVFLKGYTQDQLIDLIINQLVQGDEGVERKLRKELPIPDLRPMEQQLAHLKKNIFRSLPSSRLVKKNDSHAFSRASLHLIAFKTAIVEQVTVLFESKHYDALLDYAMMAWNYVRGIPTFENNSHNSVRRHCFKILSFQCKAALQSAGIFLGADRLHNFACRIRDMQTDCESIAAACGSQIDYLIKALENNDV